MREKRRVEETEKEGGGEITEERGGVGKGKREEREVGGEEIRGTREEREKEEGEDRGIEGR